MCFNPKETPEVTCLEWSPVYQDLIAVGIGSFDVLNANTQGGMEEMEEVEETRNCFLQQSGSLVLYSLKNSSWPEMSLRLPTGSPFCKKRSGHVKFGAIQSQVVSFRLVVNIYRDLSLLAKSNQSLIIKNHNLTTIMVKSHDLSFSLLEFPPSPPAHACGEIETLKELFFLSNPNPRSGFPAEPSSFSTCRKTGLVSLSTLDLNE